LVLRHTLGQQRHRRQSLPRSDGSLRRQQMATHQNVLGGQNLRPQIQTLILLVANNSDQEEGSLTSVRSSQLQPVATSALLTQIVIPSPWRLRSQRPCTITGRDDLRVVRTTLTSASSAFPRSERVYPTIMPLAAIRPGVKPVATSAWEWTTSALSAQRPHSTSCESLRRMTQRASG
jgi:hypothetical protein